MAPEELDAASTPMGTFPSSSAFLFRSTPMVMGGGRVMGCGRWYVVGDDCAVDEAMVPPARIWHQVF